MTARNARTKMEPRTPVAGPAPPAPPKEVAPAPGSRPDSVQAAGGRKKNSVWHNFRGAALAVMRAGDRAKHPSRDLVDELMQGWFGSAPFKWLDVGIIGMVDYERLRGKMAFRFTGADLSESVLEDSRQYLRRDGDELVRWDLDETPPGSLLGRFDLVTLRHVLNHCEYYEQPLANAAAALRPGGRIVVVLHLALVDGEDRLQRHEGWEVPGEVIGNQYGKERFLNFFSTTLAPELWVRIDDGYKTNDVLVGRLRENGSRISRPKMIRLDVRPGRRNFLGRWLSRVRLNRRTRRLVR